MSGRCNNGSAFSNILKSGATDVGPGFCVSILENHLLTPSPQNTLANGISKGRFAIPIGENNATTEGNFIVVDLNEAEDAAGAAFSKFHELFSSPDTMNLLKILDHLAEGLKGEDKVTR